MMGPIVLVCRWNANSSKELHTQSDRPIAAVEDVKRVLQLGSSLCKTIRQIVQKLHIDRRTLGYLNTPALITT